MPVWSCSWERGDSSSTHGWRVLRFPEAGGFYMSLQQMPWTDCVQPISSTSATCTLTTSGKVCQCCWICPSMVDASRCPLFLGVSIMLALLSPCITICMQFVFFQQVSQPQYMYSPLIRIHRWSRASWGQWNVYLWFISPCPLWASVESVCYRRKESSKTL